MIDKITTVRRDRIREHVGDVSAREMRELDEAVRRWLDL
jgi:mRNA-degrading endonuclease toxin of MazEF toxin-antitoxin module